MAGGADWTFVSKSDKYDTWNVEDGSQYVYWRSLVMDFEIEKKVASANVSTGPGDIGNTSGMITFRVGLSVVKTRSITDRRLQGDETEQAGARFLCIADDTERIEEFADHFMRTQIWRYVGEAEQYDPSTGAVV